MDNETKIWLVILIVVIIIIALRYIFDKKYRDTFFDR